VRRDLQNGDHILTSNGNPGYHHSPTLLHIYPKNPGPALDIAITLLATSPGRSIPWGDPPTLPGRQ